MSIPEDIKNQLTQAMKARDVPRISALRMLRAALVDESKRKGRELSDDAAVQVLRRVRKQREEAAAAYQAAGRQDLADLERAEGTLIDGFLPRLADEATTLRWVREAITATGASRPQELGRAMGALMKSHRGDIDARLARSLLEQELAG